MKLDRAAEAFEHWSGKYSGGVMHIRMCFVHVGSSVVVIFSITINYD